VLKMPIPFTLTVPCPFHTFPLLKNSQADAMFVGFSQIRLQICNVIKLLGMVVKPTRAQYFYASPWPLRIWFTAIPLLIAVAVGRTCASFLDPFAAWWDFVRFAWFVLLALLLVFFLTMFPGWFFIGPFFYGREMKNGGPFKVGDTVQILSGPHKGRVSRVYSTWQGNTLRVELGAREKDEFKDIFSPAQLLREGSA
jgi:hypothetical protein